jgi:hypothetical protein
LELACGSEPWEYGDDEPDMYDNQCKKGRFLVRSREKPLQLIVLTRLRSGQCGCTNPLHLSG